MTKNPWNHEFTEVYDYISIAAESFAAPGAGGATLVPFGLTSAWEFTNVLTKKVTGKMVTPPGIKLSVSPHFGIAWSADDIDTSKDVLWMLEYRYSAPGEDMSLLAQDTIYTTSSPISQANGFAVATFAGMQLVSDTDRALSFALSRVPGDSRDTLAKPVVLHGGTFFYVKYRNGEPV